MKLFKKFNPATLCPLCHTKHPGRAVLIPLDGTRDGRIEECMQVHLNCIHLRMTRVGSDQILYQRVPQILK